MQAGPLTFFSRSGCGGASSAGVAPRETERSMCLTCISGAILARLIERYFFFTFERMDLAIARLSHLGGCGRPCVGYRSF
jgi:hypothetical protein